jgi:hypothetical protein
MMLSESGRRRCVRVTRKFKTEIDAKQFAQEIITTDWSVIAGTLNPYMPKKGVQAYREPVPVV